MNAKNAAQGFGGKYAGRGDRARLRTQMERVRAWALGRGFFTIAQARNELERLYVTRFPENSIQSQLRHLTKESAGRLRCTKDKRHRGGGVWEYRLRAAPEIRMAPIAALENEEPLPKIRWPATPDEAEAAGYEYMRGGKCRHCGKEFLWHFTPSGGTLPLSMIAGPRLMPHQWVCERAKELREAAKHAARAAAALQGTLFELR